MLQAAAERPKEFVPDSPHVRISSIDSGQTMQLLAEWVYAFPPGDLGRRDTDREYMVTTIRVGHGQLGPCLLHLAGRWSLCKLCRCYRQGPVRDTSTMQASVTGLGSRAGMSQC